MAIALILVTVSMHGQFLQTSNVKDSLAQQTNTSAQTEAKSPNGNINKKVAVVLSGGGAKGLAHIGVLKVIERAGIPIDIITGTSMGSIVGGLYSIGYNANVLDSVVRVQDWSYVISDKENLWKQSLADRQKQNTYVFTTGMTIGKRNYNDGGFIKGKNLAELFSRLCAGYTDSLDFSKDLPIPFACVATNIIDNTEYDFHSGRLPWAMRASMAIPAAFSPVRVGDKVLVDGGLRNNFPVDIAKEMGADYVIGVTVQGAPKVAADMGSTMSILSQIIDVNCKNKYEENLAVTDIPIRVNTTGYNAASFSHNAVDTLIRRGEEEAMKHWDELLELKRRLGLADNYRPPLPVPQNTMTMSTKRKVVAYVFENMTPYDEQFIREKFRLNTSAGDSIDAIREQQLTTSMRMDLFYQTAECVSTPEGDGVRVVLTAGNRKTNQAYVGLRFDNEEHAAVQLGADIPIRASMPLSADFMVRLGKRMMGKGILTFHPRSYTCPTLSYSFCRNDVDIYVDGYRDYNILYNHHQAEFTPLNFDVRHFNLKIGLRWDYVHYLDMLESSKSAGITLENNHYFSYRAEVNYNSEDNWYFPTRGARFKAGYAYITDNFTKLEKKAGLSDVNANWRMSFSVNKKLTLQPMVYGRLIFGNHLPIFFCNAIGGNSFGHYVEQQMPFAGIGNIEYVGRHFLSVQLQAQQRMGSSHYLLVRMAGAQQADRMNNLLKIKTLLGWQAAYYYNTMFGPVGVALGYSNRTKKTYIYLNLGYEF